MDIDFLAVPRAGSAVRKKGFPLLLDFQMKHANLVLQLGDDELIGAPDLLHAGPDSCNRCADAAAQVLDVIGTRGGFQRSKLGSHFLFMILAIGGDRFGEDGHGGGGVFNLLMQLYQKGVGLIAVIAKFAAEGRLGGTQLFGGKDGAALILDHLEMAAELDRESGVDFDGVVSRGVNRQRVAFADGAGQCFALLKFIKAR